MSIQISAEMSLLRPGLSFSLLFFVLARGEANSGLPGCDVL